VKKTATFLLAICLASCFGPKPDIAAEPTEKTAPAAAPAKTGTTKVSPEQIQPVQLPVVRNTGMRLPENILALPQDDQLRSAPGAPKEGKATVIARPPEE
jgi:hypothetical protein